MAYNIIPFKVICFFFFLVNIILSMDTDGAPYILTKLQFLIFSPFAFFFI